MLETLTLCADPQLITRARQRAVSEHTTLNKVMRDFAQEGRSAGFDATMTALTGVSAGGRFSRDEANTR